MSDPVDPKRVPRPLRSALRAEREAIIARLQDAVASDDLELDELEERLDLAMTASSHEELRVLVEDLPESAPSLATRVVLQREGLPALVPDVASRHVPTEAFIEPDPIALTAIFSGHQLEGRRVLPRDIKVRALFGGVDLDFREATFMPGTTTMVVKATFGGVHIIVPPHVRVECLGHGIFGGFHADNRSDSAAPDTVDMPVLRIEGRALFGGVHAERKRDRNAKHEAAPRFSGGRPKRLSR